MPQQQGYNELSYIALLKIFEKRLKDEQRYYQQRVVIFVIGK